MSRRAFFLSGVIVALLLAGVVSYWASSQPDGLNRVAEEQGLNSQEQDSATADSPLAGYETKGVDNVGLSGGLAGVIGVGITLAVAGGLFYVLARRHPKDEGSRQQTAA